MHLVLSGGALTRWRATTLAILVFAVTLIGWVIPTSARAEYQTVAGGLSQWMWLRGENSIPMTAAAVRRDGWLVVSTQERFDGAKNAGGGLLLAPPWGGSPIPFGDPIDRSAGTYGYLRLVVRGDRLFGLTSMPEQYASVGQKARLVELDASTGRVVATHGTWWFPDLAVDPQSGDLVLWNFRCEGRCGDGEDDEEAVGSVRHDLVRYDPDARRTTQVLVPDAMDGPNAGSGTCGARRATLHNCEEVFRVAFSDDGTTLFLGTARGDANAIDVRGRGGELRYSIPVARPVDAMAFGTPTSCLAESLVFTSFDGTAWVVPNATDQSAAAAGARSLATGAPIGTSAVALTPDGNVLTLRRSEGVLLACPGWSPPLPPAPRVASPPVAAATAPAGAPAPSAPAVGSPTASPVVVQPPAATPVAPPGAPPAAATPTPYLGQFVSGISPGLADAEEEQPVYSLTASARSEGEYLGPAALLIMTTAALGLATAAWVLTPESRRLPRLAKADRR